MFPLRKQHSSMQLGECSAYCAASHLPYILHHSTNLGGCLALLSVFVAMYVGPDWKETQTQ